MSGRPSRGMKKSWLYTSMEERSITRRAETLTFSREVFYKWLDVEGFEALYVNWEANRFDKALAPSVDRINPDKGYVWSNMQLVIWEYNEKKGLTERYKRPVAQFTLKDELVATYISIAEAARKLGKDPTAIRSCLIGVSTKSYGFKWEYI